MTSTILQLSDHPALEESYRIALRNLILDKLCDGPIQFETLVREAEGAYPTDVRSVLMALSDKHEVMESNGCWFLSHELDPHKYVDPSTEMDSMSEFSNDLPEPHPLDFDWRFTESTLPLFRTLLQRANSASDNGAILGAPSLYKYLIDQGARVSLFDKNSNILEHLRRAGYSSVTEVDLMGESEFSRQFDWAVADPPWYNEYYGGFMRAASRMIRPGGKLLISVLPRLTRPTAASDRFFIIELARTLGFDLVELHTRALGYKSPPFEIEALREEGLQIGNWRKGDLFIFVLSSYKKHESIVKTQEGTANWLTIPLGTTSVRINSLPEDSSVRFCFRAASTAGTYRLRSVSRRSPTRIGINVWTSRNIALIVSKPSILIDALTAIGEGALPSQAIAHISTRRGLRDSEARELRKVLKLLLQDAGLSWE